MKIKSIFFIAGLIMISIQIVGQNFQQEFYNLMAAKDTVAQLELLKNWEKADSNDPELYVSFYNYYANRSLKEVIRMDNNPKGDKVLQIMDTDTTNTEPVGYLYSDTYFDTEVLNKGFKYIDKGIEKFPNRLDMRFGKIYMLGRIENYDCFTAEIINTINYSSQNNNEWTWSNNEPIEHGLNVMLEAIQDYQAQLFDTDDYDLLGNMERIALAVLSYYPKHIESMSNLSIVYLTSGDFDKALDIMHDAIKIAPTDYIVFSNMAYTYRMKGDIANAIKYYELTLKYGDEQFKEFARIQIENLKNQ
jgi:tetratricopeptide (TPR) repeat protein